MATVYSLLCFGGLTGKVVTFTVSGSLMNATDIGVKNGLAVWFSGGVLPTGLTAGTLYYARKGADNNKATLHATKADALAGTGQVTITTTGSGTIYCKSSMVFTGTDLSRWGNTRVYGTLAAFNSGRSGANSRDDEVCEIGEEFESAEDTVTLTVPSLTLKITSSINGIRTPAFHNGIVGAGFTFRQKTSAGIGIYMSRYYQTIDGFSVDYAQSSGYAVLVSGKLNSANGMLVRYIGTAPLANTASGIYYSQTGARVTYNRVLGGFNSGITIPYSTTYCYVCNNTVTGCTTGIYAPYLGIAGFFYNNVSLGNTTNWTAGVSGLEGASNNVGGTGEAWKDATGTRIEVTEAAPFAATFVDYAAGDLRLKAGSQLIDAGYSYYTIGNKDIADREVPCYAGGAAEYVDCGCHEFDKGFGARPASHALTLTNVVVGSRVLIRDQANTVTHYDQIAASSTVAATLTVFGDSRDSWRIKVRKASAAPYYQPFETLMTATAGASSIYVNQLPDQR